ncbi:MAG: ORF6N domain-containing protein [Desulfobacterales bacterium]|nr:ORF6N domain-containing protein [Desulfobacterales bacterium]
MIYLIRGQKVMLGRDLSALYGVETRVLKQAVRRNIQRFPEDFMFGLIKSRLIAGLSQGMRFRSCFLNLLKRQRGILRRRDLFGIIARPSGSIKNSVRRSYP